MSKPLPIAIVIPHAGLDIPPEIKDRIVLTEEQIFNEADVYADLLYDFRDTVLHWHSFPCARALIDVNRPADDAQHHRTGDGVVKRKTSYGDIVFAPDKEPDEAFEQQLIERYWQPWHNQLAEIAKDERVKFVLDCHSMAALGPSTYDDPSQIRPRVSVSNWGDLEGNKHPEHPYFTAPPEQTRALAARLGASLSEIATLAPVGEDSAINEPFWGGWNIAAHGGKQQPWFMIELNRGLYIGSQTGNSPVVPPHETQIAQLRESIWQAIEAFVLSQ